MENHDINYLINKYSKSSNDAKNEDFQSSYSPKLSFSPFRDPNSKAYAAAMRALHERIRFLERENAEMVKKYKTTEERLIEERRATDKLRERVENLLNSEKNSNQIANELKQELMNMKKENSILHSKLKDTYNSELLAQEKEKNYIKEELADFKKENQRLKIRIEDLEINEMPKLYKENLHLKQDLDRVQRNFSNNISGEATQNMQVKRMEEKIDMLRDQILKEKQKNENYFNENPENKYNFNKHSKNDRRENAILRQKEHFIKTIKDLEDQSRSYDDEFRPKSQAMKRDDDLYTRTGTDNQSPGRSTTYRQRNGEGDKSADTSPRRGKRGENSSSPSRRGAGYRFSPYDEDMKRGRTGLLNRKGKYRERNEDDKSSTYRTISFRGSKSKSKSSSPSSPNISRPANRHIGAHLNEYGFYDNKTEY